ncbi:MAG: hypothetical protein NC299_16140 [Lachnospiraceae bacterium]|nr:hypothetical protein [Ruminococcus sp.]MCM1276866.1 hypothetical protein [Lachnospiraceae bacterium]
MAQLIVRNETACVRDPRDLIYVVADTVDRGDRTVIFLHIDHNYFTVQRHLLDVCSGFQFSGRSIKNLSRWYRQSAGHAAYIQTTKQTTGGVTATFLCRFCFAKNAHLVVV